CEHRMGLVYRHACQGSSDVKLRGKVHALRIAEVAAEAFDQLQSVLVLIAFMAVASLLFARRALILVEPVVARWQLELAGLGCIGRSFPSERAVERAVVSSDDADVHGERMILKNGAHDLPAALHHGAGGFR